jgi:hypothetical protein
MILADVERCLRTIGNSLKPILSGNASQILEEAIRTVQASHEISQSDRKQKRKKPRRWGYSISPARPLEFQDCSISEYKASVDLFGSFWWPPEAHSPPVEQNLTIRIWSRDSNLSFREKWDSEGVKQAIQKTNRRVISRFHFDLANSSQPGPKYHLQLGGVPHDNECCWIPKAVDLPRLAHPPVDIALACQIIAANFFPNKYEGIKTDPSWWATIRGAQHSFFGDYFQLCNRVIKDQNARMSLLDQLWNLP